MIGVVSDIHGNYEAFQSVLNDMGAVEGLICCGDIVGYGPDPRKCIQLARDNADICVIGNHERALVNNTNFNSTTARSGLELARKQLHGEDYKWIKQLPHEAIHENRLHVTHSHPNVGTTKRVMPNEVNEFLPHIDTDIFVYGHTHHPVSKTVNGTLFVNPGSVGQPRDGDPRASYAILDPEANTCTLNRVNYDIERTCERADEEKLPEELKERLRTGN